MHFQHVSLRFIAWVTEDALENHGYVTHQIHRVIVHDNVPGKIELFFRTRFFFDRWRANSGWRCTPWKDRNSGDKSLRHFPPWLHAHEKMLTYAALSSNCSWHR